MEQIHRTKSEILFEAVDGISSNPRCSNRDVTANYDVCCGEDATAYPLPDPANTTTVAVGSLVDEVGTPSDSHPTNHATNTNFVDQTRTPVKAGPSSHRENLTLDNKFESPDGECITPCQPAQLQTLDSSYDSESGDD